MNALIQCRVVPFIPCRVSAGRLRLGSVAVERRVFRCGRLMMRRRPNSERRHGASGRSDEQTAGGRKETDAGEEVNRGIVNILLKNRV